MSNCFIIRMEYLVSQFIEVVDNEIGEVIDSYSESEYYSSYSEACKRADELRHFIGEEICSWGDCSGVLQNVYCDDEPRGIQYYDESGKK